MPVHAALPQTFADYLQLLGAVPADRVHTHPAPGTASLDDWFAARQRGAVCELIDGTLVDKAMGLYESLLAACLAAYFRAAAGEGRLGITAGEQGFIRLPGGGGQVRAPDVAFFLWSSLPNGKIPADRVPMIAPDIAVEVLSEGNTITEMMIKRKEYFAAGTQLVWIVDRTSRSVAVYTSPLEYEVIGGEGVLTGGDVLPDLRIIVADLFAEVDGDRQA